MKQMEISSISRQIQKIQKERKELLHNECRKMGIKYGTRGIKRDFLKFLLVDDKHKVLYCYVPKAGCTSWRTLLVDPYNRRNITYSILTDEMNR